MRPTTTPRLDDEDLSPLMLAEPLVEMERAAAAVAVGDSRGAAEMLEQAKKRLQQVAVDELHRLVGETVTEVSRAATLQEKLSTAIVYGARLIESRPPDHLFAQFADAADFVERCRAACAGLLMFFSAQLNNAVVEAGAEPLAAPEAWVKDLSDELHQALLETRQDGLDRKAHILGSFMGALGADMDNVSPMIPAHSPR